MKRIIILTITLLHQTIGFCQIVGDGNLVSKTLDYQPIKSIYIEMYAKITIDAKAKGIKVEAEASIIDYINFNYSGAALTIDQKKWIEPTQPITITIGAPEIQKIIHDTWDETTVVNIDNETLFIQADIGTVVLEGNVKYLKISSQQGRIIAKDLEAKTADIRLKGSAQAVINVIESVHCDLVSDARLDFINKPSIMSDCESTEPTAVDVKYIDFTIQNNSWSRRHFVVVGPKPDGRSFSYGFPLMPGQKKSERWTTGTKIYKENAFGKQTLLVTIDAKDEGQLVKLFQKD